MRTSVSVVLSILIAGSSWSLAHGNPAYSVTGVAIGSRVDFDSTAYQEYRCDRSEMFDGITFQASEAISVLWKEWNKKEVPEGWKLYAVLWPSNDKWNVSLCSQKISGGSLYKSGKLKSNEVMELPRQTSAVIPISEIMERVSSKLSELLGEVKNQEAKGQP